MLQEYTWEKNTADCCLNLQVFIWKTCSLCSIFNNHLNLCYHTYELITLQLYVWKLVNNTCKSMLPGGRKIRGRAAPESGWTDDCGGKVVILL